MRKGEMRRKWVREIGKTREERREKEMKEIWWWKKNTR